MTSRLVGLARREWVSFDGQQASDPLDLPPDRFLNKIYVWATQNADSDDIAKFDRRLWLPPKGEVPPAGSPWSAEAEEAAFGSLAAAFGTGAAAKKASDRPSS